MTSGKPQVLFFGIVHYAHETLAEFEQLADIVQVTASSKQELLDVFKSSTNAVAMYLMKAGVKRFGGWDDEIIAAIPKSVKFVNCYSAGYDWVPVEKLGARGIQCSNTNDPVADATADTGVFLLLGALRTFNKFANALRTGGWSGNYDFKPAHDPEGKVLGIIGMGGIGRKIRDKVAGFDFKEILYYNRSRLSPELEGSCKYSTLDDLLANSDAIVLALPLKPSTHHLINAETLAKCKDGVVIVNIARGPIIDEQALVDALASGKVYNVGLDVFENEPHPHPDLIANENAMLLPHVGTTTVETRKKMEVLSMQNLMTGMKTGKIGNLVVELRGMF